MYTRNELYQPLLTQEAQHIVLPCAFAAVFPITELAVVSCVFKMFPWPIHCGHCNHGLLVMDLGTSPADSTGHREEGACTLSCYPLALCRCSSLSEVCAMSDHCPYSMEFRCANVSEILIGKNVCASVSEVG